MTDKEFRKDCLFILGMVCAMAAGAVTGVFCTWVFILVCSVVLIVIGFFTWITITDNSDLGHALVIAGVPLFLVCCWCSFWISLIGVLRK